jgi:competence protein ComEA
MTMTRDPSNLAITISGVAVLTVIAGAVWFGLGTDEDPPSPPAVPATQDVSVQFIRVHVSGAVGAPGVVQLSVDAIVADAVAAAGGAIATADLSSINLAAPLRAGERVVVPDIEHRVSGPSASADIGIDINTATAVELESLPGVGPVLAQRIIAYRTERGAFHVVEDLLDVPGIGEAKLSQMRDSLANL